MFSVVFLQRASGLARRRAAWRLARLLVAACAAGCSLAAAADGAFSNGPSLPSEAAGLPRPHLELTSAMPSAAAAPPSVSTNSAMADFRRLGAGDTAAERARGDGFTPPLRLEISGWSRPAAESAMGLTVGFDTAPSSPWADNRGSSSVDLGVRWRSPSVNQRRIDVVAFRRMNQPQDAYTLVNSADQPLYSARVEMQFQSAKFGGLAPELGAIGMQLNGGGKVVLRAKRGGPMVYYRSRF